MPQNESHQPDQTGRATQKQPHGLRQPNGDTKVATQHSTTKAARIARQKAAESRNAARRSEGLPTPWDVAKAARKARRVGLQHKPS